MIQKNDYELYFLNNMYSDELIFDMVASFRNRLYYDILAGKGSIQNNRIDSGPLNDFTIDNSLNYQYGIEPDSFSIQLNSPIVPFYSDKRFTDKHEYGKVISSMEILTDHEIFSKSLYLFVQDYFVYDFQIVIEKDFFILFIPVNIHGMSKKKLMEIMSTKDSVWTLLASSKSDYYYTYMNRASLFSDDKIYISSLTEHHKYGKPVKNNAWTLYVSKEEDALNFMVGTHVSLEEDDNKKPFFRVPLEFKQFAYQNTRAMKCLIVNEPECTGTGIYVNSNTTEPIFQIPFKKNPIPIRNLIVWKYDNNTKQKCHPLVPNIEHKYPNIYDFTKMVSNHDLYIEWIEPMGDASAYDSYIQDYIDCYGPNYSSMIKNSTANSYISKYRPVKDIDISSENYFTSKYRGDYRAWKLDKIVRLMKDNPHRYEEFYHRMYYTSRKMVKKSYTYERYPHIYERSVMDNGMHCNSANERIVHFTEPQAYIKVYNSSCIDRYCALYINGVRKTFTYNMTYGSDMYIYFPTSYIENHETIQIDIGLDNNIPIDDIWFKLDKEGEVYRFKDSNFLDTHCISDLIFYDHETLEIIPMNNFSLSMAIKKDEIQFSGMETFDVFAHLDTEEELFDNRPSLVVPTNADYIVLNQTAFDQPITDYSLHKEIDLQSLSLTLKNSSHYMKYLHIATTNFYQLYTYYIDTAKLLEDERVLYENGILQVNTNSTEYVVVQGFPIPFPYFKGKHDSERFRVYVNGLLQSPSRYIITFSNLYDDAVTLVGISLPDGKAIVEYLGFDEELIYDGPIENLKKTHDDIIYMDDFLTTPFDLEVYRIFVDGYRITNDQIKILGQNTMIMIKDPDHPITITSNIMIYKQVVDRDPYEYTVEHNFLTYVMMEDPTFRSYIIDKYAK